MKPVVTRLSVCCVKRTFQQRLLGKWLCLEKLQASDVNRPSAIVERSHDFNLQSIEKVRSGAALVTGKVHKICSSNLMFGYKTGHWS